MSAPTGSSATLSNPTSATLALTVDQSGNYTIALSISDGHVTSTPDTVVVSTINSRPVANAGTGRGGQVGRVVLASLDFQPLLSLRPAHARFAQVVRG